MRKKRTSIPERITAVQARQRTARAKEEIARDERRDERREKEDLRKEAERVYVESCLTSICGACKRGESKTSVFLGYSDDAQNDYWGIVDAVSRVVTMLREDGFLADERRENDDCWDWPTGTRYYLDISW